MQRKEAKLLKDCENYCDLNPIVHIEYPEDPVIEVEYECCEMYLGPWRKKDTSDNFVIDGFCTWNEEGNWNDDVWFYEECKFNVYITCIPETIEDLCWYDTNNVVPFAAGNGKLFGACS